MNKLNACTRTDTLSFSHLTQGENDLYLGSKAKMLEKKEWKRVHYIYIFAAEPCHRLSSL